MSAETSADDDTIMVRLKYQKPYNFTDLLNFYRMRALQGIELVAEDTYSRTVRICDGDTIHTGWISVKDCPSQSQIELSISGGLKTCQDEIAARIRRMFDVDRNPQIIEKGLASLATSVPKAQISQLVLPGCFEPFETTCRAVLGQQISVKAANNMAARIVENYGIPIETGHEGLSHAWPTPKDIVGLAPLEEAFGPLGVIKNRSRAIEEIARLLVDGKLNLSQPKDADEQIERLLAVKGIGPWTASYIAMRALSHSDVFLEKDVGVIHALPDTTPKQRLELAENWRPWRSYAVIAMWNSLTE